MFPGINFRKIIDLLRDRTCLEKTVSSNFQAFLFLQKITGISPKATNSRKRVLHITGPHVAFFVESIISQTFISRAESGQCLSTN